MTFDLGHSNLGRGRGRAAVGIVRPAKRPRASLQEVVKGVVLVAGRPNTLLSCGPATTKTDLYFPDFWRALSEISCPGRFDHSMASVGQRAYVMGGQTSFHVQRSAEEYQSDWWRRLADMPEASRASFDGGRTRGAAFTLDVFPYYVAGRTDFNGVEPLEIGDFDKLRPAGAGTWQGRKGILLSRWDHAGWEALGLGFIHGGFDANEIATASTERYTPATNSWANRSAIVPQTRAAPAAFSIDGIGYVHGGAGNLGRTSKMDSHDDGTDSWTVRAATIAANEQHAGSTFLGKGYVMAGTPNKPAAVDGQAFAGTTAVKNERYDPATDAWIQLADVPVPDRGDAAAAGLA